MHDQFRTRQQNLGASTPSEALQVDGSTPSPSLNHAQIPKNAANTVDNTTNNNIDNTPIDLTNNTSGNTRQKRTSLACIRCRTRHIRCPGGEPCKKCHLARTKCEYVEADKKIVVSMKYLSKLHDDIARLKKENAAMRIDLKELEHMKYQTGRQASTFQHTSNQPLNPIHAAGKIHGNKSSIPISNSGSGLSSTSGSGSSLSLGNNVEVINPSLDKHGRLILSRTGEKVYVGSSSMTLFGLEIQNMVPSFSSGSSLPDNFRESNRNEVGNGNGGGNVGGNGGGSRVGAGVGVGVGDREGEGEKSENQRESESESKNNNKNKNEGESDTVDGYLKTADENSLHSATLLRNDSVTSLHLSPKSTMPSRKSKILESEGNAYKITLLKTNTRPGLNINFSLPSYSYAMLLVDTFINYNDGCFYFFNEGLVKKFLTNIYSGKMEENRKILRRNETPDPDLSSEDNCIKKDADDDTILETIWFCKILLIFSVGEMYLGTESDTHVKRQKQELKKRAKNKTEKHTLPGAGFFFQASELFTGLFASGAIDNITKDGGIEAMLLYAFYLQVADCTIASYFYFGLALRAALILGWHVDADQENIDRFELEHRRRIWWTVYMYERMLSSKAGLPLSFADDSVSTELPADFKHDLTDWPRNESDVRGYYIFPRADYINNCVTITQINALILSSLYTKQPSFNILPIVSDLVQKLISWKTALPEYLDVDYSVDEPKISRLIVNLMTEYFQGINLAVRPLLFYFASKKFKELQETQDQENKYIDLTKYSKNVLSLLNASFQASINTVKSIWSLLPENMVALFGWMDREYLFTSASTLILFNASFGVHEATKNHLDHALVLFTKMKRLGNYPAALRRAQLLKLIRVLDFNGVMTDILEKHDDDFKAYHDGISSSSSRGSVSGGCGDHVGGNGGDGIKGKGQAVDFSSESQEDVTMLKPEHDHTPPNDLDFLQFASGFQNTSSEAYADLDLDLEGFEDLPNLDEEQKLWKEITNEAGWLHVHSTEQPDSQHHYHYADVFNEFAYNNTNLNNNSNNSNNSNSNNSNNNKKKQ